MPIATINSGPAPVHSLHILNRHHSWKQMPVKMRSSKLNCFPIFIGKWKASPNNARTIFKLYFLKQLSSEEIAGLLGISPQTARSQKARAIQLLKLKVLKKVQHFISLLLIMIQLHLKIFLFFFWMKAFPACLIPERKSDYFTSCFYRCKQSRLLSY